MNDSSRHGGFPLRIPRRAFSAFAPVSLVIAVSTAVTMALAVAAVHAEPTAHNLYRASMPPGLVGRAKSMSSPDRYGYVQSVEVRVPEQCLIAPAAGDSATPQAGSMRAGLMLGDVYRFKLTNIPQHETQELYPSIEVIDRLHPPAGEEDRFPVPVEITQEDIELALRGDMVVRVIYVEDPSRAFPESEGDRQRSFDVAAGEDPLRVADDEGRPIAILRLGSRVPLASDELDEFHFGYPSPRVIVGGSDRRRPESMETRPASGALSTPTQPR
jgi:hypothetical protein